MSSEGPQNTPEQGRETPQILRLAHRLLAPGVVDVTTAQRRYDRAVEPAERSRAISRLASRYGPADAHGRHGGPLLFRSADRSVAEGEIVVTDGTYAIREPGPVSEAAKAQTGRFLESRPAGPQLQKKEMDPGASKESGEPAGETAPAQDARAAHTGSLQRLVQRSIAPGMINTKQAEQQFERIANPGPERISLVNRLRSRGTDAVPHHVSVSAPSPADYLLNRAVPGTGQEFPFPKGSPGQDGSGNVSPDAAGANRSVTGNRNSFSGNTKKIPGDRIEPLMRAEGESSRARESGASPGRSLKEIFRHPQPEAGKENTEMRQTVPAVPIAHETPPQAPSGIFRVMRKKTHSTAPGPDAREKNFDNAASMPLTSGPRSEGRPGPGDVGRTIQRKELQPPEQLNKSLPGLIGPGPRDESGGPAEHAGGQDTASSASSGRGPADSAIRAGSEAGLLFRKPASHDAPVTAHETYSGPRKDAFSAALPESGGPGRAGERLLLRKPENSGVAAPSPRGAGPSDSSVQRTVEQAGNNKAPYGSGNPVESTMLSSEDHSKGASTAMRAASGAPLLMRSPVSGRPENTATVRAAQKAPETTPDGSAAAAGGNAPGEIIDPAPGKLSSVPERTPHLSRSATDSAAPLLMRSTGSAHQEHAGPVQAARKAPESMSDKPHPPAERLNRPAGTSDPSAALPSVPGQTGRFSGPAASTFAQPLVMRAAPGVPAEAALQRTVDRQTPAFAPRRSGPFAGTDRNAGTEPSGETRTEIPIARVDEVPVTPATPLMLQRRESAEAAASASGPESAAKQGDAPGTTVELGPEKTALKPAMIWRRNDREMPGVGSGPPNVFTKSAGGLISREAAPATAEPSTGSQQGNLLPAMGTEAQAPALDLDLLAEQVGRLLFRRIETERERRGVGL